ncbi:MAG: polysaccharide deacetylase family protein [Patescibacteria group bacterium]|nr:polysaccharide deacetylase family protein [Patescibacteria group bacterium]
MPIHTLAAADVPFSTPTKVVYLTFDGDMTPFMKKEQDQGKIKRWYDPTLFAYLEKNNVPATFFITGMFAEMYPSVIKDLAAHPNFSIQNHSYSHPSFEAGCYHLSFIVTDQEKRDQIEKAQKILTTLTGITPTYFRYPGLCHSAHDDNIVKDGGLDLVQGQFGSGDAWMKKASPIVRNVLKTLSEHNNVVIFHLGNKLTPKTTLAIKLLVPKLERMGYTFKKL